MTSSLLGQNVLHLQNDPERRAAHRLEIRRALAHIEVRKSRIAELREIVKKLEADSENAADQHSEAAERLQKELREIDEKHVTCVLSSEELPAKLVTRRSAILDEIVTLNKILEETTSSNQRAIEPIQQEINATVMQTTEESALRNQLANLCSPGLRQRRMLNSHLIRWMEHAAKDAARIVGIEEYNVEVTLKNRDPANEVLQRTKLADAQAVLKACQREVGRLLSNDHTLRDEALSE
jgi:hypothetical protein